MSLLQVGQGYILWRLLGDSRFVGIHPVGILPQGRVKPMLQPKPSQSAQNVALSIISLGLHLRSKSHILKIGE
jgi:hypothetical protein